MTNYIITFDTLPGHGTGWITQHADQEEAEAAFEKCRGKRHDGIERITLAECGECALIDLDALEPDDDGLFV